MIRTLRSLAAVAALVGTLLGCAGLAQAARKPIGTQPGASCSSTASAVNQYCEDIPTAAGGGTPPPGAPGPPAPSLATTLPKAAVRAATRKRARALLSIPAPGPSVPITASVHKSSSSFPTGLLVALIAIAAALAAGAFARHRRHTGSGGSDVTSAPVT
jgi:hypothetical protein